MAIDLINEHRLSLQEAARLIPSARAGKKTHVSKVLRLILDGKRCRDGVVRRLDGLKIGSSWVTTQEAIQRFAEAVTAAEMCDRAPSVPRTSAQTRRASEQAVRELAAGGIR